MAQMFSVILSLSVSGGLIGLLILLIRPVTRQFFAKKWTYYLWLLVFVRLVVPVHMDINLMEHLSTKVSRIFYLTDSKAVEETGVESAGEMFREVDAEGNGEIFQKADTGKSGEVFRVESTEQERIENGSNVGNSKETADGSAHIFCLAGILWLLGMFLSIVWRLYSYRRFYNSVCADCIPVTNERVLAKSAEIQTRMRMGCRVPLYESTVSGSPMLIGIRKPRIILSSKLLEEMAERENDICLILHHELVHYKRRDIWYKWLFQAVLCIHWFNPLLYLYNRKFNIDCELACDEMVMALLTEEGRKAYGDVLLDVAETNQSGGSAAVYKNVPAMTLLEERHTLKERLHQIALYHKRGFAIGVCSAVVLIVLIATAVFCGVAGVRSGSGEMKLSGAANQIWKNLSDTSFDDVTSGPMWVDYSKNPYRMYDEDDLIAGDCENDIWRVQSYRGGGQSVEAQKFLLNGSDTLWIMYVDKDTTLEISSSFTLKEGRFKVVQVLPDKTVRVLNESGDKINEMIALPAGRNYFKVVGQKARLQDLNAAYSGTGKKNIGKIFRSEDEEYAYLVQSGAEPFDAARLGEVCVYLEEKEVSGLGRTVWDTDVVLSEENWQDIFIYSDSGLTSQYLLEALQSGKVKEFDSRILGMIACYMSERDVSECFRCLLERGKVAESDWESIFLYSDPGLSAEYLLEALQNGRGSGFDGKVLGRIGFRMPPENLTDIVLALDQEALLFEDLRDLMPYLEEEQNMRCVLHYISLGNILSDSQLQETEVYVSQKGLYRIIEENGKNK